MPFNQTNVELKRIGVIHVKINSGSFNQTNVELKLDSLFRERSQFILQKP